MDGSELTVAQSYKRVWGGMQESLGECKGGSGGGACGTVAWDGAIMRGEIDSFSDTFVAVPWNVDAVTNAVVRGRSKIPTFDTVGVPGAMIAGCFVNNDADLGGC